MHVTDSKCEAQILWDLKDNIINKVQLKKLYLTSKVIVCVQVSTRLIQSFRADLKVAT